MEEQLLVIDTYSGQQLRQIAKWSNFLSIVGFVMCGIIIVGGLFAGTIISMFMGASRMGGMEEYGGVPAMGIMGAMSGILTALYIGIGIIYFFPTLYLFQFSTRMKNALNINDQQLLGEAFSKLKACLRFIGVLTIIVLSFYALIIVIAVIGAAAFRH